MKTARAHAHRLRVGRRAVYKADLVTDNADEIGLGGHRRHRKGLAQPLHAHRALLHCQAQGAGPDLERRLL